MTVRDEGAGIPDYALNKLFDKFYSLQRPDTGRKSTGLGLNLVQEVAAVHKGTVRLDVITSYSIHYTKLYERHPRYCRCWALPR